MHPFFTRTDWRGEHGATAAEYAIMASLIAAVIVVVVAAIGLDVANLFGSVPTPW